MDHLVVAPRDGVLVLRRRKVNMTVVCVVLCISTFFLMNLFVDIDIYIYVYMFICEILSLHLYIHISHCC